MTREKKEWEMNFQMMCADRLLHVSIKCAVQSPASKFIRNANEFLRELGFNEHQTSGILDDIAALFRQYGYRGSAHDLGVAWVPHALPGFEEIEICNDPMEGSFLFYGQSESRSFIGSPVSLVNFRYSAD